MFCVVVCLCVIFMLKSYIHIQITQAGKDCFVNVLFRCLSRLGLSVTVHQHHFYLLNSKSTQSSEIVNPLYASQLKQFIGVCLSVCQVCVCLSACSHEHPSTLCSHLVFVFYVCLLYAPVFVFVYVYTAPMCSLPCCEKSWSINRLQNIVYSGEKWKLMQVSSYFGSVLYFPLASKSGINFLFISLAMIK